MNNYCVYLKKRKNKPYCKIRNEEIRFSLCRECSNKEYKKNSANLCKHMQTYASICKQPQCIKRKKSDFRSKSPVIDGLSNNDQMEKNSQSLGRITRKKVKMRNKSNKLTKLEKNRYSVFSNDTKKCYLCGSKYKLTWHEIYAGRNRQNSMKYGLCLRMCLNCHSMKQENSQFNEFWHKQGQIYWEEFIGTREEFIKVFRRNYLRKNNYLSTI